MTDISLADADYIDFGCSAGGSLKWGRERFGGKVGVGVDIDPKKIALARAAGANAVLADASQLELEPGAVSYCTMVHFLEHLPGLQVAGKCIRSAVRVARDFVYIRHPWFNSDFDLYTLGYKFYWSDWKGHTCNLGLAQMDYIIRRSKVEEWTMYGITPVTNLDDPNIIELTAPRDSVAMPNGRPSQPLPFRAFKESGVLIRTGSSEAYAAAKDLLKRDHVEIASERRARPVKVRAPAA
ncbi:MAG TPA: class I SAM-dependent methyltransferase [Hyphomonadaceae bacterium]|nr:class I SAM-dependent methyltransferase [Hyphomonadaceae bacterium]HPI47583.1 class I SAM-dependent methyltransferase [Hyphomonadaceae bacterium]